MSATSTRIRRIAIPCGILCLIISLGLMIPVRKWIGELTNHPLCTTDGQSSKEGAPDASLPQHPAPGRPSDARRMVDSHEYLHPMPPASRGSGADGADSNASVDDQRGATTPDQAPRLIQGSSVAPTGGKPVGPLDISWDITASDGRYTGHIGIVNHGIGATVEVTMYPIGDVLLQSLAKQEGHIAQGGIHQFTVMATCTSRNASLGIMAVHRGSGARGRAISIPLTQDETATKITKTIEKALQDGVRGIITIRDNAGQVIELHPSQE